MSRHFWDVRIIGSIHHTNSERIWDVGAPDAGGIKRRAEELKALLDQNLKELSEFENQFETDIASRIHQEIDAVSDEAKAVAAAESQG